MIRKSKQRRAEGDKTISINDLATLRFKMLKPGEGIIEIVNSADQGRICTLIVSDFRLVQDAQVYGQLIVLAPQMLSASLMDAERLIQVVERFKKFQKMKEVQKSRAKRIRKHESALSDKRH